jgi:SAM-dependent methyltransferase
MGILSNLLSHPLTRGLDLDDVQTTELRKQIIGSKPFLKKIYEQWYTQIQANLPSEAGPVLELGTGAGFLKKYIPGLITSDVTPIKGNNLSCNAVDLPFVSDSLEAIVMINVLHHIFDANAFFKEASRCVRNRGVMIMIEPWVTPWSRIVYNKIHHEPFEPDSKVWELPAGGPLSVGNDALPWIIFERDVERFKEVHDNWAIKSITPGMPFNYILSGGVSMRNLMPGWAYRPMAWIENNLPDGLVKKSAMFSMIILECVKT